MINSPVFSDNRRNGLVEGFKEAIELAENGISVMKDHADDQWVIKMLEHVLGTEKYDENV